MRLIIKLFAFILLILTVGCVNGPGYTIDVNDNDFMNRVSDTTISVIKFDAITPSSVINSSTAFGIIGVLVADAATSDNIEKHGLKLQNKSMLSLNEKFNESDLLYKPTDIMAENSAKEISDRFKSNRMWGFSSLTFEEVKHFFEINPDVGLGVHLQTFVYSGNDELYVDTEWILYEREGLNNSKKLGSISTVSVVKEPNYSETSDMYFNEIIGLQNKNIDEFIKLLQTSKIKGG